jgi:PrtD family type I secretion system ABC transporter
LMGIMVLAAVAWLTEWCLRDVVARAESSQSSANHQVTELTAITDVFQAHGQFNQVEQSLEAIKNTASQQRLSAEQPGHSLKAVGKLIRQILQLAMLAAGAWLVIQNQATGGVMIAGSILLGKALMPLEVLIGSWKYLLETRKARTRLLHAIHAQTHSQTALPRTTLPRPTGALQAKQLLVKASGSDSAILQALSFSLPAGAMLAVLGPSGSGKSTLARVLAGALAPTRGELALDGAALHQYTDAVRGRATGYLPQDVQLHNGSIAHNIARQWGCTGALSDLDSAQVIVAAKLAAAHDLITSLPKGYDTLLGDGPGTHTLSGGQRQRIALARAVFGNPSLVILDEPNSQLDADGEAALESCLLALRERKATVVVISHRPHLIELSSHVLVLREGRVEQFGLRIQVRQWMIQRSQLAMKNKGMATDTVTSHSQNPSHDISTAQAA